MEYTKSVTIACPIRDRETYLPFYLNNILNQTYPKELTNLFFVTNNVTDDSIKILKKFKTNYSHKYPLIRIDSYNNDKIPYDGEKRIARARDNSVYDFLAQLRNYIRMNINTEYLFSVDSDIMLYPDTLERLIKWDKKCISALVCNGHMFAKLQEHIKKIDKYKYTNVLKRNIKNMYTHFRKSELKGLIEVDVTGAVYLISREIYKNCEYKLHPQGEDIPFCEDVQRVMKEKLYCDTDLKLPHCMCEELLEEYKNGTFIY